MFPPDPSFPKRMLFSHVILGFAVTVAAIDICSHYSASCSGNYVRCVDINPDTCWGVATAQSLAFVAIPFNWRIECRGYSGGNCANRRATIFSNGRTSVCVESGNFLLTGGVADDAASQQHKCTSRQKPDAPVLEDGSEYDVSGLEEDSVLSTGATDGSITSAADVPEEFKSLSI